MKDNSGVGADSSAFMRINSHLQGEREDSLKRHHDWQNGLDKEAFFNEVFSD